MNDLRKTETSLAVIEALGGPKMPVVKRAAGIGRQLGKTQLAKIAYAKFCYDDLVYGSAQIPLEDYMLGKAAWLEDSAEYDSWLLKETLPWGG